MKITRFRFIVAISTVLLSAASTLAAGETPALEFRTRLAEASKRKPDFAGHFIVAKWGCGTGCVNAAFIDAKSGGVYMLPFAVFAPMDSKRELLEYRLDSSLFVIHGSRDEEEVPGDFYYRWDGKNLIPVTGAK